MSSISKDTLEKIYQRYNLHALIHPDPLEFLFNYSGIRDREIVSLIASSLAYGRVAQILKSVTSVLSKMGSSPADFLSSHSRSDFLKIYSGFKHRFTTSGELADFLFGIQTVLKSYGSLEACFASGFSESDETVHQALASFVGEIKLAGQISGSSLLPDPSRGSACKRLHLFLRWQVRHDSVDPGGWNTKYLSKLIVPLDTHMFRFSTCYGFTARKNADLKAAVETTRGFRAFMPEDPAKYDFALTRFGIRADLCWNDLNSLLADE